VSLAIKGTTCASLPLPVIGARETDVAVFPFLFSPSLDGWMDDDEVSDRCREELKRKRVLESADLLGRYVRQ